MTATQISIDTAPRDLEGLKKVGRFNLRVLAQALGVFSTEAGKAAYMQLDNDAQATAIKKLLDEHFGGSKGGAGKTAGTPSGRTPATKGGAGKTTGASKTSGETTGTTSSGTGGGAPSGEGAAKILAALQANTEEVAGLRASIDNLAAAIEQLQGVSAGTNRFVALSIGLSGKLAEETLGAPLSQVLEAVMDDMPAVEAAMASMAEGDAPADEGESDAGNEE